VGEISPAAFDLSNDWSPAADEALPDSGNRFETRWQAGVLPGGCLTPAMASAQHRLAPFSSI
jgi:hypothetical protein